MAEAVHKTNNGVLIDNYAQKTALRLGVTPDSVRLEFRKFASTAAFPTDADEPPFEDLAESPRPTSQEFWLLKLLLVHEDLLPWASEHLKPDWVQHPVVRQIIAQRLAAHTNQTWTSLGALLDDNATPEMQNLITEAAIEDRPVPNPSQQLADLALYLRNQAIDRELAAIRLQMNQPQASDAAQVDLLGRLQELRLSKRQPLAPLADPF
jgi:hypothetical protein